MLANTPTLRRMLPNTFPCDGDSQMESSCEAPATDGADGQQSTLCVYFRLWWLTVTSPRRSTVASTWLITELLTCGSNGQGHAS